MKFKSKKFTIISVFCLIVFVIVMNVIGRISSPNSLFVDNSIVATLITTTSRTYVITLNFYFSKIIGLFLLALGLFLLSWNPNLKIYFPSLFNGKRDHSEDLDMEAGIRDDKIKKANNQRFPISSQNMLLLLAVLLCSLYILSSFSWINRADTRKVADYKDIFRQQPQTGQEELDAVEAALLRESLDSPTSHSSLQLKEEELASSPCIGWRQTRGCAGKDDELDPSNDEYCDVNIFTNRSGYCMCNNNELSRYYPCHHSTIKCDEICRLGDEEEKDLSKEETIEEEATEEAEEENSPQGAEKEEILHDSQELAEVNQGEEEEEEEKPGDD